MRFPYSYCVIIPTLLINFRSNKHHNGTFTYLINVNVQVMTINRTMVTQKMSLPDFEMWI